jgi:hypothetical protein
MAPGRLLFHIHTHWAVVKGAEDPLAGVAEVEMKVGMVHEGGLAVGPLGGGQPLWIEIQDLLGGMAEQRLGGEATE